MSRYLPNENWNKDAHANSPEGQKASKKVDTFSRYDHQRRRNHVSGRNRNQPYLLSMRRMSGDFSSKRRENEAHAHPRLKATTDLTENLFVLRYDYQATEATQEKFLESHKESAHVKKHLNVLTPKSDR